MEQATSRADWEVRELSREEGRKLFDRQARRYLGISGEEFLEKWDSREYGDPDDRAKNPPGVMELAMLLPFVR